MSNRNHCKSNENRPSAIQGYCSGSPTQTDSRLSLVGVGWLKKHQICCVCIQNLVLWLCGALCMALLQTLSDNLPDFCGYTGSWRKGLPVCSMTTLTKHLMAEVGIGREVLGGLGGSGRW